VVPATWSVPETMKVPTDRFVSVPWTASVPDWTLTVPVFVKVMLVLN
jgi:hypothetical protein